MRINRRASKYYSAAYKLIYHIKDTSNDHYIVAVVLAR